MVVKMIYIQQISNLSKTSFDVFFKFKNKFFNIESWTCYPYKDKKFLSILNEDEVNTDDYYLVEVKIK
jgi:hypothetical protein